MECGAVRLGSAISKRPSERLSADVISHELDAIFLETIFPVATYLAALFGIFTFLHPVLLERPIGIPMAIIAATSGVLSATIGLCARNGRIEVRYAYLAGFGIFGLGLSNSAIHMWLVNDIVQSSNFALIYVSVGLFFLSRWRLALAYAITFATWCALVFGLTATKSEIPHFAIMNLQAIVIGLLAQHLRLRVNRRLISMRSESNVRERKLSEALAKEKLYVAAERENKAKTEFLANMSHELRTPLNAILGFSEMMAGEIFGPINNKRYSEYTHIILDAGRHLLSLVNDILDLSRIQLDARNMTPQTIDLDRVCKNCLAIVRERAQRGEIALRFQTLTKLPQIETDERRLKQILINLLTNAVKFTPPSGSVVLEAEGAADGGAVLRVRDTGIGMSPSEIESAGKPFWQAQTGLDRTYEGTGLGLALVRELLTAMNGSLSLTSEPGRGTLATVTLPPSLAGANAEPQTRTEAA
jgi:signal transduction histidine kinase